MSGSPDHSESGGDNTVDHDERLQLLTDINAFGALPHETRVQLASLLTEERFDAGAEIIREGEQGDRLYIVARGDAHAWTTAGGNHVRLARMGPGSLFGELALIYHHSIRQASVTADSPLLVLSLTDSDFDRVVHEFPEVQKIFTAAARRMLVAKFLHVNLLYRLHFQDPRRERMFLASVSFLISFASVRSIAIEIRRGRGPFKNVTPGGLHIHHLVWGILLLLGIGYIWLLQFGTGLDERRRFNRSTAMLYGLGSALTLDEFALWLHLQDVYWSEQGRRSIDAVVLFGSVLSVGLWGGPFFRALVRFLLPSKVLRLRRGA